MLFAAIAFEVLGTMLLPASQNFSKLLPTTILLISYGLALLSAIFYKQTLNWQTISGLFLIVIGVTIVNIYRGQY